MKKMKAFILEEGEFINKIIRIDEFGIIISLDNFIISILPPSKIILKFKFFKKKNIQGLGLKFSEKKKILRKLFIKKK